MAVGAIVGVTQTDVKRLLAYSSVAHAGFLLTAIAALAPASARDSASGVMFYLVAYGFMTIGAFAIVMLVRDGDGEANHLSRWVGLGRRSPLVAGIFAFFLLALAGLPGTSGLWAKVAVFKAAGEGGGWPLVVVGVAASALTAYYYFRIVVLMFFQEPLADGPTVELPKFFTSAAIGLGLAVTLVLGVDPAAAVQSGGQGGVVPSISRVRQETSVSSESPFGLVVPDAGLEAEMRSAIHAVEGLLRDAVKSDYPFVTETSRHLVDAGGKRFRPLLVLLAAQFGDPAAPGVLPAAVVVELTHLADAVSRRRDGRSPRSTWHDQCECAVVEHDRDPDRRLPVLAGVRSARRPRARSGADPGAHVRAAWFRARSARRPGPSPGPIHSSTTCRSSPTRPVR